MEELAQLLSITPEQVPLALGRGWSGTPAASAACQVVRDLAPRPSSGLASYLRLTLQRAEIKAPAQRAAWLDARTFARDAASASAEPEEQGKLAASALREAKRIGDGPIADTRGLALQLGVGFEGPAYAQSHGVERMLIAALPDAGGASATLLPTPRTSRPWGQRFEEARAVGHAILDSLTDGALGAASTPWAQEHRRRRSGAFAAELLLPEAALHAASHGELDGAVESGRFVALLTTYGVGARTAAHQLHNHGLLSSASIRDELIDLHARD